MDIYDNALIDSKDQQPSEQPPTELDQQVSNLVSGISSWWSGVAQKSQARKHVDEQGGILSYAKNEYSKLAPQTAPSNVDVEGEARVGPTAAEKGKAREHDTILSRLASLLPKDEEGKPKSLADIASALQAHLPVDLAQSQQLASKYMAAGESFAKELVRIVPPEEAYMQETKGKDKEVQPEPEQTTAAPAPASMPVAAKAEAEKDEGFDWEEEEGAEQGKEVEAVPTPTLKEPEKQEVDSDSDWE